MKMSNLHRTLSKKDDSDSDEESSEESEDEAEDEAKMPRLDYASIAHFGCVNRIRVMLWFSTLANKIIECFRQLH